MDQNLTHPASNEKLLSEAIAQRRATPSFDGSLVPDNDLHEILQAGIASPSAYNIQPWRFIIVSSTEQKKRLREAAMGQPKVEEAGVVIVCCGDLNASHSSHLDEVLAESLHHGFNQEQNKQMKEMIQKNFSMPAGNAMGITPDYAVWLNRQVMIAFTTMMWKAETLGYDTAPMEGFFEDKVKSVLTIPEGIRVVALLGIGKLKGKDKAYAGRCKLSQISFKESWGKHLVLHPQD